MISLVLPANHKPRENSDKYLTLSLSHSLSTNHTMENKYLIETSLILTLIVYCNSQLSGSQQNLLLQLHNQARLNVVPTPDVPLPALTWNSTLANYAQNWSAQCIFDYSDYSWFRFYGENIAVQPAGAISITQAFNEWYDSGDAYNFESISCTNQGFKCDPFLQIVWRRTTQLGCGLTTCFGGDFLVCSYDPAGSWPGILPFNSSQIPTNKSIDFPNYSERKSAFKEIDTSIFNESFIDWRLVDAVTPAKFQGTCGSCWTFSAVGAMESQFIIATDGAMQTLSEEQLLDCSRNYPNNGCDGGHPDVAFKYVIETAKGSARTTAYPYTGVQTLCDYKSSMKAASFKRTVDVANGHDSMISALLQYGPIPVFMTTDTAWQNYGGGRLECSPNLVVNHAILLVGWNNSTQQYIIKNSWGPSWGENGFAYVDREQNCGMLRFPTSAILMT